MKRFKIVGGLISALVLAAATADGIASWTQGNPVLASGFGWALLAATFVEITALVAVVRGQCPTGTRERIAVGIVFYVGPLVGLGLDMPAIVWVTNALAFLLLVANRLHRRVVE